MTENKYELTGWANSGPKLKDVTLPSGQVCQVKELQMEDILSMGIINQLDSLTGDLISGMDPSVPAKATSGRKKTKKQLDEEANKSILELMADPEKFGGMLDAINKIVVGCVVQPTVLPAVEETEREQGRVYVDMIDFNDRITLFTEGFQGLGDMSKFRPGQGNGVGDLAT